MFAKEIYIARRKELCSRIGKGLILLPGNVESPLNYPNNTYHFRQDSTFMYFFGHSVPSLMGLIDAESGVATLYGDDFTVDDYHELVNKIYTGENQVDSSIDKVPDVSVKVNMREGTIM